MEFAPALDSLPVNATCWGTVPQTEDNGTYIYLLSQLLLDRHQHGQRSQDSDRTALVAQR